MQFTRMSIEEASREPWDVVVAGTSFAAMFFAHGLAPGRRVLFLEKGLEYSNAEWLSDHPDLGERFPPAPGSRLEKPWVAHSMFGGNSNCWWGQVPRHHPSDFRLKSLYGVGSDWPFGYETLEPYYAEVEAVMEAAGGGSDHHLPRSGPFPYPPHAPSKTDVRLRADRPDIWHAAPSARSNGGSRPICCVNGICSTCPIDAKFTILNGLPRLAPTMTAALVLEAEVRAVDIDGGAAKGVLVRGPDGTEHRIGADLVALGTNAIFNAAILMRSGHAAHAMGRYLHEQGSLSVTIDVGNPNYFGGTSITGHCYGFYDGPHRSERAAVLVENFNAPTVLRSDRGRWTERMLIKLVAEDIPNPENRVVLDGEGEPQILWHGHDDYMYRGLHRARAHLHELLTFPFERIVGEEEILSEAHIQGTHRMGTDPETSVVDPQLRVHGVTGLLALGSGCFPACSPANPTLTLSALSLMAGRSL
ncbi:MAG: GMC family oxidoreductase [Rhodobacteraceae bacterium]|jgi:choline dehydrogenase-like flavoprotein|nr:GMC family oxidoreductase [Paracoccaceae bacterium]